jgi:hypothetical protein
MKFVIPDKRAASERDPESSDLPLFEKVTGFPLSRE